MSRSPDRDEVGTTPSRQDSAGPVLSPPPRVAVPGLGVQRSDGTSPGRRWAGRLWLLVLTGLALYGVFAWLPRWADSRTDIRMESSMGAAAESRELAEAPHVPEADLEAPIAYPPLEQHQAGDSVAERREPSAPRETSSNLSQTAGQAVREAAPRSGSIRKSLAPALAQAMTVGLAALATADFAAARVAFGEALEIDAAAPGAADGLAQAEQGLQTRELETARVEALEHESREAWSMAVASYDRALAATPTAVFALEGLARARRRAQLDAALESHLARRDRLSSAAVRAEVEALIAQAAVFAGTRLSQQVQALSEAMSQAVVPLRVVLESDGRTEVRVYQVGALGSFTTRELDLPPGTYTVVGRRAGYRDVRRTIEVSPGGPSEPVRVACEDRL